MRESHHPIFSAILSIAFIVVVQIFAAPTPVFRFLLPAFVIYAAVVGVYNYFYLKRSGTYNFWTWLRPLLFIIAWFGVFFIIPSSFWRGVYLLLGVVAVYVVERNLGKMGEQLLFNETLITAFTGLMTLTAFSHYFLVPGTVYLILVFIWTMLIVRASYELTPQDRQAKWVSSVVLGIALTEVFWVGSFLPLHYSALGLLIFNVFYCAWTLGYYFLYNHLTPKKIQFHVVLALVFTAIILAVTPWRILQ